MARVGGEDLRLSVDFVSEPLAEHRTAADGCAPVRQPLSYTLTVPQSVPLQVPSRNSKALEQDVYRKSAAVSIFYRYWCGIYHCFDCFGMWYVIAKCGMVLVWV